MPEDARPLVSICCATYNHERFIGSALEGFLAQRTDFPFEILVSDDASRDGTPAVLLEYQRRNPGRIDVTYHTENQFSKGARPLIDGLLPLARGEFVAICEGDDYWTDPEKLRKQLAVLRRDTRLAGCFTNALMLDTIAGTSTSFVTRLHEGRVPERAVILGGGGIYPTASLVFRRDRLDLSLFRAMPELPGDELLILSLMARGGVYYLPETTCVYRRWSGGVYSSVANNSTVLARRKQRAIDAYDRLAATPMLSPYAGHLAAKVSSDSLYVLRHLGLREGRRYLRRLRPADLARFARHLLAPPPAARRG